MRVPISTASREASRSASPSLSSSVPPPGEAGTPSAAGAGSGKKVPGKPGNDSGDAFGGDGLKQTQEALRARRADACARDAYVQLAGDMNAFLHGDADKGIPGLFARKGKDALDLVRTGTAWFKEKTDEAAGNLDDAAAALFRESGKALEHATMVSIARHEANERRAWKARSRLAAADTEHALAVAAYTDMRQVEDALARKQAVQVALYTDEGLPPKDVAEKVLTSTSATLAAVFGRHVEDGNYDRAESIYGDFRVTDTDRLNMAAMFRKNRMDAWMDEARNDPAGVRAKVAAAGENALGRSAGQVPGQMPGDAQGNGPGDGPGKTPVDASSRDSSRDSKENRSGTREKKTGASAALAVPADVPANSPANGSARGPERRGGAGGTLAVPGQTPGQMPGQMPGQTPGQMPGQMPGGTTAGTPGGTPNQAPRRLPPLSANEEREILREADIAEQSAAMRALVTMENYAAASRRRFEAGEDLVLKPVEEFTAVMGEAEGRAAYADLLDFKALAADIRAVRGMTPEAKETWLRESAERDAKAGAGPDNVRSGAIGPGNVGPGEIRPVGGSTSGDVARREIVRRDNEARAKDPALYAVDNDPPVQESLAALLENPGPEQGAAYLAALRAAWLRLGMPDEGKYLTNELAGALAYDFLKAPMDPSSDVPARIDTMQALYGKDFDAIAAQVLSVGAVPPAMEALLRGAMTPGGGMGYGPDFRPWSGPWSGPDFRPWSRPGFWPEGGPGHGPEPGPGFWIRSRPEGGPESGKEAWGGSRPRFRQAPGRTGMTYALMTPANRYLLWEAARDQMRGRRFAESFGKDAGKALRAEMAATADALGLSSGQREAAAMLAEYTVLRGFPLETAPLTALGAVSGQRVTELVREPGQEAGPASEQASELASELGAELGAGPGSEPGVLSAVPGDVPGDASGAASGGAYTSGEDDPLMDEATGKRLREGDLFQRIAATVGADPSFGQNLPGTPAPLDAAELDRLEREGVIPPDEAAAARLWMTKLQGEHAPVYRKAMDALEAELGANPRPEFARAAREALVQALSLIEKSGDLAGIAAWISGGTGPADAPGENGAPGQENASGSEGGDFLKDLVEASILTALEKETTLAEALPDLARGLAHGAATGANGISDMGEALVDFLRALQFDASGSMRFSEEYMESVRRHFEEGGSIEDIPLPPSESDGTLTEHPGIVSLDPDAPKTSFPHVPVPSAPRTGLGKAGALAGEMVVDPGLLIAAPKILMTLAKHSPKAAAAMLRAMGLKPGTAHAGERKVAEGLDDVAGKVAEKERKKQLKKEWRDTPDPHALNLTEEQGRILRETSPYGKYVGQTIDVEDYKALQFSQTTVTYVKNRKGVSYTYDEIKDRLYNEGWNPNEPITAVTMPPDGKLTSFDNTRLTAVHELGGVDKCGRPIVPKVKVYAADTKLTPKQIKNLTRPKDNFYPETWGDLIRDRIRCQFDAAPKGQEYGIAGIPRLTK